VDPSQRSLPEVAEGIQAAATCGAAETPAEEEEEAVSGAGDESAAWRAARTVAAILATAAVMR